MPQTHRNDITFRRLQDVSPLDFIKYIQSPVVLSSEDDVMDDLFEANNSTLKAVMKQPAPLQRKNTVLILNAPW